MVRLDWRIVDGGEDVAARGWEGRHRIVGKFEFSTKNAFFVFCQFAKHFW